MITCLSTAVLVTTTPPDGSGGGGGGSGETGNDDIGAVVLIEGIIGGEESPEPGAIGITGAAVGQLFALG